MSRAFHKPITILVETISHLPTESVIPQETQMTANLRFDKKARKKMILFLLEEEFADEPLEFTFVTITGPSP